MPQPHLYHNVPQHQSTQYRFAAAQVAQRMPLRQTVPTTMATAISNLQNRPLTPQPSNGMFELHLLQYCPPAVRVCFGCSQTLKPDNCVLAPPYDMTVVSRMYREFCHQTTGERMSKEGNVYFHLNSRCIQSKQPCFQPHMLTVANQWVLSQLTAEHLILLRQFGVRI